MKPQNPSPTSSRTRQRLALFGKVLLGAAALGYVLSAKMIDFDQLGTALRDPRNAMVAFSLVALSALLCALRWYRLAKVQGLSMSAWTALELTLIGNFFNTFLPGSVGGDVIKAWYAAGRESTKKARAVFTVLFDRAVGLSVFVLYATLALLPMRSTLPASPQLDALALALVLLSTALVVGAAFLLVPWPGRDGAIAWLEKKSARVSVVSRLITAVTLYRHQPGTLVLAVVLTALSILGLSIQHYWQGAALGVSLPLTAYFFVVPVALTVSAVPLLPGGLGVGQVAFFTLFRWLGSDTPEQGATLCTAVQLYTILFNCVGALVYVRFRRTPLVEAPGASEDEAKSAAVR